MSKYRLSPTSILVKKSFSRIPVLDKISEGIDGKSILLTGSTGFFGKWLLAILYFLEERGANFNLIAVSRNPENFLKLHPEYRSCHWISWISGDVRQLNPCLPKLVDLILHAATDTSEAANKDQKLLFDTITYGMQSILKIARENNAQRILVTGSGAQYRQLDSRELIKETNHLRLLSEKSAYARGKCIQERLVRICTENSGLEAVFTRCFTFAGPALPLDGHFAIGNFVRDALGNDQIQLSSDGKSVRSYMHGADLAAWLIYLLLYGKNGEAYNVGSDQPITIGDLALKVIGSVAPSKKLLYGNFNDSKPSYYVPDIDKALDLGLGLWSSLDDCISEMAAWSEQQS